MYWFGYSLIFILGMLGLIGLLGYLRRSPTWRPRLENAILVVLALFITLMALEFYFKVFFAQSDSITSLANRNWNERYFDHTLNSLGYRDSEWTPEMVAGKTKVMDERVATPVDPHPSELVHERVAEALYNMFLDLKLANPAQVQ